MNYRHIYHAGSFVDVTKHVVLLSVFDALKKKDTPFCYIDTHAGSGLYDLTSPLATKTNEHLNGISKIWKISNPPLSIRQYLSAITTINKEHANTDQLKFYPGSPAFAQTQLRDQDRAILCELEKGEYTLLQKLFKHDRQFAVHHQDGLLGLKAFLPPKEKRGLILIDSPFENINEFSILNTALTTALNRFNHGIYILWYPIKDKALIKRFHRELRNAIPNEILNVELSIYPESLTDLSGSGMVIVNPPWKLKETLNESLTWLWNTLSINKQGTVSLTSLK